LRCSIVGAPRVLRARRVCASKGRFSPCSLSISHFSQIRDGNKYDLLSRRCAQRVSNSEQGIFQEYMEGSRVLDEAMTPFEEDNGIWLGSGCFPVRCYGANLETASLLGEADAEGKPRVRDRNEPCPTGTPCGRQSWGLPGACRVWRLGPSAPFSGLPGLVEVPRGRQPRTPGPHDIFPHTVTNPEQQHLSTSAPGWDSFPHHPR